MFLRFTRGRVDSDQTRKLRKCIMLGNSLIMEYGDKIVGVARLHDESEKCLDYDIVVSSGCEIGSKVIVRYIKDMIGKSNRFSVTPSRKRHKYYIEEIEGDYLPISARIVFSKL